jgi:SWI/SNF-related matrix-associated actin-dependent regulator 1 of chromatin subfamily A
VGYLKRLAARLKLKYAVEWVDRFLEETDEKIVLFGTSTPLIRAVQRRYGNACVTVDGNVTGRKRDAAIHEFQTQRKTRVLMGNIIAAGEAITLSAASNIGFMEFDWRPGKNKQARARCTFIGQTKPTFVYYFVAAGTMEVRLCEVLQKKEETITQVLDGDEAAIDFNILDMLLEKMAEDANARIPTISHR